MKKISIIILGLVCAAGVLEALLRTFLPQPDYGTLRKQGRCYQSDKNLYVTHKPNTACENSAAEYSVSMHINNGGFRTAKPVSTNKPNGIKRILFIGDSYTFGHGVQDQESYPSQLTTLLNTQKERVEVLNAGVPGVGLDWYYMYLKEKAFAWNPDLIVVGIFLGNDLFDATYFDKTIRDSQGFPTKIGTSEEYLDSDGTRTISKTPLRYKIPILRNSHLFLFVVERLYGHPLFYDSIVLNGSACFLRPDCRDLDSYISQAEKLIGGMKDIARAHNTPIVFALLPWELQFPRRLMNLSQGNVASLNPQNRRHISETFVRYCANSSLTCVDLLPSFEAYTGNKPVYFPQDRHWTVEGHAVAAQALLPMLTTTLWGHEASQASEMAR
jgi:hypothetical protein